MGLFLFKTLRVFWQMHKPLGWSQLTHRKVRLLIALTGVAFSNILIFTQLGLRAMLFEGITLVPDNLKGDLFLVSAYSPNISFGTFSRIHLYQADAVEGVETASALYIWWADWMNPEDMLETVENSESLFPNTIKVLAFNPSRPVLTIPEIEQQLPYLSRPGVVLYDRLGQPKLGPIEEMMRASESLSTLMNNKRVHIAGMFSLGSTLDDEGHIVMSDWNYANWFGEDKLHKVNVGCLTLAEGANIEVVRSQLQSALPESIRILTKTEMAEGEQVYHASYPTGKVLNFGAVMGFIVGVVVVYQVLYTDVSEHLPEYATLKAMGYSDRVLLGIILQEATFLAVLGFIPGYLASYGVYQLLVGLTRVPLTMKTGVVLQVFMLTLVMCGLSGMMAMNKLRSADPADVF